MSRAFLFISIPNRGGGLLGVSLWWNWVAEFKDAPDNARLLQNVLSVAPRK